MIRIGLNIIIILLFLSHCGYTPIYSKLNTRDLNINILNVSGDIDIKNLFARELGKYKNLNSEKNYSVEIISTYKKDSLTKDAAGDATNYRLTLNADFITNINSETKILKFQEQFDMKKGSTIFEEEKSEKFIKQDMVNLIIQKFVSQIIEIK